MKMTLEQLMLVEPNNAGLEVVPDPEFQQKYKIGIHYITRAKPGFALTLVSIKGVNRGEPTRGELHWCTATKQEKLRCHDRGCWRWSSDKSKGGFMVHIDEKPEFELAASLDTYEPVKESA